MRQLVESIHGDVERGLYDGAVVMVARGGRVECCEAVGYADRDSGRAMREDDVFAIYSIAKAMTSVTVLQGIEKGAYTLRTPVADLVPEFAAEDKGQVTIGQLLSHTGGMNGGLFPVPADTQGDLSVMVDAACRSTLNAPPGERVSYSSGLAHAVLAEVVRRCDGGNIRFRDILARDLFDPLDMKESALGMRADLVARAVPVVVRDRATGTLDPDKLEEMGRQILDPAAETEIPSAGVVATAADVFAFVEALRQGGSLGKGRILSPATIAFATQDHTGDRPSDLWTVARELHGWPLCPANLGLGFVLRGTGDIPTPFGSLASPTTFGATGAGSTVCWVDPEHDISFVCLTAGLLSFTKSMLRFQRLADIAISSLV